MTLMAIIDMFQKKLSTCRGGAAVSRCARLQGSIQGV